MRLCDGGQHYGWRKPDRVRGIPRQFAGWLCLLFTVTGCSLVNCLEREERQFGEIAVPVVTALIEDVAKALFHKILENWLDPDNVDVVFIGRAFRIHKDAANQVTVTDRASGNHVTMTGRTLQDATNTACENLLKILLVKGVMSVDDLHLPPTLPPSTLPPCVDNNGAAYCKPMVHKGYCAKSNVFGTFMTDNCRKSCRLC